MILFSPDCILESLYIHWPFCPYKCHFCPFVALASHEEFMGQYHEALCQEIIDFAQEYSRTDVVQTIFLGGGTPSTYPSQLLLDMFGKLERVFKISPQAEITIEVNPGTVTDESLSTWQRAGINRLSIGVQSLNDTVLKKLNRHQSAADVRALIPKAAELFDNISVDLIVGLPGITLQEWQDMLTTLVAWPIKHCSVYFLTVHEDTPLYFGVKTKKITLPADDAVVDTYIWTVKFLQEHGFVQYEVSNFAKPGYESRHNSAYWRRVPYKGFGLGACSFDGQRRFQNEKNLSRYCVLVQEHTAAYSMQETLTEEQVLLEKLMLGLRQTKGISYISLAQALDGKRRDNLYRTVDELCAAGYVVRQEDTIRLSIAGLAVENEIVVQLSRV